VQIWTSLAEDEGIQQLDQREEKLNVAVQDLKQRQKTMPYIRETEGHAGDEKPASRSKDNPRGKTNKTGSVGAPTRASRKDDNRVGNRERKMEQAHSESIQVLKEHITMQVVETLTEKVCRPCWSRKFWELSASK
jgi:hypothetical protein